MDTLFVDLHLFPSLLHTATPATMERFSSPHGRKMISEPEERDGGTKPLSISKVVSVRALRTVGTLCRKHIANTLDSPSRFYRCKVDFIRVQNFCNYVPSQTFPR